MASSKDSSDNESSTQKVVKSVVRACSPTKDAVPPKKPKIDPEMDRLQTRTGGAYIPPAKLRAMQQRITDKSSESYQRISWEALKKSLNGLVNKVNVSNLKDIVMELLQENLVRGRGLLARSIITAQNASPTFTNVYASLVAVINSRFPQNGQLILYRLANRFKQSFRRNIKDECLHASQFIAHLVNQQVANEIICLQMLYILLNTPTNDSVEVAIGLLKECGQKLTEVSPRSVTGVFEQLRIILHEQELDKRVQYMIEVMFQIRKDGFKEHPSVLSELDHVNESDQFTHEISLENIEMNNLETNTNVFQLDENFLQNEESYQKIKAEILDESDSSSGSDGSSDDSSDDGDEEEDEDQKTTDIQDMTETNLVALRRNIYLAIQSSLSFEECAHRILKMQFNESDFPEIFAMIIDCCSQQRTYEKFYGLLAGRFCQLKQEHMEQYEILFGKQYETIHRLETNKLRNVAKFFAHLLHSDSIPWSVFANVSLTEETTTSSGRIFLKILLLEVTEYMGIEKLNERLNDPTLAAFFEGLLPRSDPKATRFAINFLTTIGLGALTEGLREHLKQSTKEIQLKLQQEQLAALAAQPSSNDDTSSSSEDSSSSSSSEEEVKKKKNSRRKKSKKSERSKNSKKSKKRKSPSSSSSSSSSSDEEAVVKSRRKKTEREKKSQKSDEEEEAPQDDAKEDHVRRRDRRDDDEDRRHHHYRRHGDRDQHPSRRYDNEPSRDYNSRSGRHGDESRHRPRNHGEDSRHR